MKIQLDDVTLKTTESWEDLLLAYYINSDILESDVGRRLVWIIEQVITQSWTLFFAEWWPKLQADPTVTSVPVDQASFINLVVARPDYQDRKAKEDAVPSNNAIQE